MAKHKTKKRSQKGGAWYDPFNFFGTTTTDVGSASVPTSGLVDDLKKKTSDITGAVGNTVGSLVNSFSPGNNLNTNQYGTENAIQYGTENQNQNVNQYPMGGKRKQRHSKMMKGGSKSRKTRRRRRKH